MKVLRPFFPFYGSKWKSIKIYPEPLYQTIIEPFAGSASYSLRYPQRNILLYDADPIIVAIWNYLIKVTQNEILQLPTKVKNVNELKVYQEAKWLIGFWLNRGSIAPCNIPSSWMRNSLREGRSVSCHWGEEVRQRIANQIGYIRHWKVKNSSYQNIDTPEASYFIDPPYSSSGNHYQFNNELINYPHLGNWCKNLKGQIIVCEQKNANWLPFKYLKDLPTTYGKYNKKRSPEAIWVNQYPINKVTQKNRDELFYDLAMKYKKLLTKKQKMIFLNKIEKQILPINDIAPIHRKSLLRKLRTCFITKPPIGRRLKYNEGHRKLLISIWKKSGYPCSPRLKEIIKNCKSSQKEKRILLRMSVSHMDNILKNVRYERKRKNSSKI